MELVHKGLGLGGLWKIQWLSFSLMLFLPVTAGVDSLEKTLMLGKIEGERRGQQRMKWLDNFTNSKDMNLSELWEMVKDREA